MIIEFVGPPASGKSTVIQNLKEDYNLNVTYQSDVNLTIFTILTSFINLKTIIDIYFKIFFTTNLTFSNKRFYSRHISRKIIYFNEFDNLEKPFIPDEGLINIYLSILSIHNISIYKVIEKYIDFNNYYCILLKVDLKILNQRLLRRGPPEGWENRSLFSETVNKEDLYYKIQEKFLISSDDFFQNENIKFYLIQNNSNFENTTSRAEKIINIILN